MKEAVQHARKGNSLLACAVALSVFGQPGAAGALTRTWRTQADFAGGTEYAITVSPTGAGSDACITLTNQSYYAADPTANPAVSFWSYDPREGRNWRVTKYDPLGNQLWTESYNSLASDDDMCLAIGLDSAGNAIAAGYETRPDLGQGTNLRIRRYLASGGLVSAMAYDSPANDVDQAVAITVSPSGACVVAGAEYRPDLAQGMNWLIRRYNADGSLDASFGSGGTVTYNDAGDLDDYANGVAFDAGGGFVVAGTEAASGQGMNWLVRRYDAAGNPTWGQTYNSSGNLDDEAFAVAVSPAGTVAVAGYEDRANLGGGKSWLIRKYTSAGAFLTSIQCAGTAQNAVGTAVGADIFGNPVVVGYEAQAEYGEGENWLIRKYDQTGALLWRRAYNGPANGNDRALGVAVDAGGNCVVAGYEDRSDAAAGDDWLARRYDASGNVAWSRTHRGAGGGNDRAAAAALDSKGAAVVAGWEDRSDLGQGGNWLVRKYDSSGNTAWTRTWNGISNGEDHATAVAVAKPSGSVYVAGYETTPGEGKNWRVLALDYAGNLLWTFTFNGAANADDVPTGVAVDPSGSGYVAGTETTAGEGTNWRVFKFAPDGSQLLTQGYNSGGSANDIPYGVGADRDGNFAVAGSEDVAGQGLNWRINRYAPDGTPGWTLAYNDPGNLNDAALGVAVTASGTVIAAGCENRADVGLGSVCRVWQISPGGGDVAISSYVSATCSMDTVARAAAYDSSGNLVVAGYEDRPDLAQGRNWLVRKYDPANSLLWSSVYNAPGNADDEALSVAADGAGNVVVAGYVTRLDANQGKNWMVRKYTPAGAFLWAREYNSNSINDDVTRGVAVDAAGNITVAGDEYRYDLTQMVPLPYAVMGHAATRLGSRIYVIGGCQKDTGGCGMGGGMTHTVASVYFAPIDAAGDATGVGRGKIGPWTAAYYQFGDTGPARYQWGPPRNASEGMPIMRHQAVGAGNRLYVVGGTTQNCGAPPFPAGEVATTAVYSAAVDPVTGQTGPWERESPLMHRATRHGLVYASGALYCLGGVDEGYTPGQFVQKAEIGPDGHLYSSNGQTWDPVLAVPPGDPPDTCQLCMLCSCYTCAPCTEACCRALNVCLGWNDISPFGVMRTIGFVGGEYTPGSSGMACRYDRGAYYGLLGDCNEIKSWLMTPGTAIYGQPAAGAAVFNGSLLSVGGGNGSAVTNQVLFNPAGRPGLIRTEGDEFTELRPASPDGNELYRGGPMEPYKFPSSVSSAPVVAYAGFAYAIGGEMGGPSSPCGRVYRAQLASTTWWVDAGHYLSAVQDLGVGAELDRVSWTFEKTGGKDDDWVMVRYRTAGEDGKWTCWTTRVPEEGVVPQSPGVYEYASDRTVHSMRAPLMRGIVRYLQFEVSLYNDPSSDAPAPTIPRFTEFKIEYHDASARKGPAPIVPRDHELIVAPNVITHTNVPGTASLAAKGAPNAAVDISIYNEAGALVRKLRLVTDGTGVATGTLDGADDAGRKLGSGTYWAVPSGAGVKGRKAFAVVTRLRRGN